MKKKKGIYIYFVYLPVAGRNGKKSEENGFQRFYSVKLKKINFYKFILVY